MHHGQGQVSFKNGLRSLILSLILCVDSALMKCLGDYASVPPVASTTGSVEQAAELCAIQYVRRNRELTNPNLTEPFYSTKLAGCWAEGTYCREWLPMQTAGVSQDYFQAVFVVANLRLRSGQAVRARQLDVFCYHHIGGDFTYHFYLSECHHRHGWQHHHRVRHSPEHDHLSRRLCHRRLDGCSIRNA